MLTDPVLEQRLAQADVVELELRLAAARARLAAATSALSTQSA